MAQPSLIYRRSALAFPFDVSPGFDPLHPASRGMGSTRGCSGVASGANFVSLLPGTPFTASTTTGPITEIGPTVASTGAGFVNCVQATTTVGVNCTLAWIFSLKSVSGNVTLFQDTAADHTLFCNTDATLGSYNGSVTSSGIALTANVPYFVIASQLNSNITWFVVNLKTGQQFMTAGTTNWGFGGVGSPISICGTSAHQWNGNMAAVMFSPAALNRQQCLQWCADPWSFWYPRGSTSVIAAAAAGGSFLAAWARNSNLPVIGTGNY